MEIIDVYLDLKDIHEYADGYDGDPFDYIARIAVKVGQKIAFKANEAGLEGKKLKSFGTQSVEIGVVLKFRYEEE